MKTDEFLTRYQSGQRNFSSLDLRDVFITNYFPGRECLVLPELADKIEFQGEIDFSRADLSQAVINNLCLRNSDFSYSNLTKCDFRHCSLGRANFSHANLAQANLKSCGLYGANFSSANLANTNLSHSYLASANFSNANLANADLSHSNFYKTDFTGVDLSSANLEGTGLLNANLTNAINVPEWIFSNTAPVPKNNPSGELVHTLRSLTEGKNYHSEGSYPIDVVFWNTKAIGNFQLEELLVRFHHLEVIELEKFWQDISTDNPTLEQQYIRVYQNTIKPLKKYLDSLKEYKLISQTLCEYCSDVEAYILVAQTKLGDWLAISLQFQRYLELEEVWSSPVFEIKDTAIAKPEYREFITTLENTIETTKQELPKEGNGAEYIDGLIWNLAADRDLAIQNTLMETRHFKIETCSPVTMFGEQENTLLTKNLIDKRIYYVGSVHIHIYLVGQTVSQDWIVMHTEVIWT